MADTQDQIIKLEIDPGTAMAIIANIQLATRHPKNTGPSRHQAEKFARALQERVVYHLPEHATLLEMGWDPDCDIGDQ